MHKKDKKLRFLRKKIGEISLAMFRAETDSFLQLPNNIITPLRTDEEGNIWFFTAYKGEISKASDNSFPACLEFYKKGVEGRLFTNGLAAVVPDAHTDEQGKILIRFRIMHARYTKNRIPIYRSLKTRIVNFFSGLFSPPQFQEFDLQDVVVGGR
ncbi:MAG TPA: hypothetical protein PKG65_14075 [Ferruginibacter sp.]|nr:hypothetical protein [Ferruginibacter sp.]HNK30056.1 hypothetical protein [Ferruginibacter sp.]